MEFNPPIYLSESVASFPGFAHESNILGMSLQEMIDTDIKAEFDDISCGNTSGNFGNVDTFDLLDFKFDDDLMIPSTTSNGFGPFLSNSSSLLSHNYMEDMSGAVMVNPINVMGQQQQLQQHQSPQIRLSVNTQFGNEHGGQQYIVSSPSVIVKQAQLKGGYSTTPSTLTSAGIKSLKIMPPMSSPMQQVPSPSGAFGSHQNPTASNQFTKKKAQLAHHVKDNGFPKPAYSYSCLIALALKNSRTGAMSVAEIYKFMCEHFPYFRTAPSGWKNSVRHNLSLNKCFEKIEKPATNGSQRKGCLWAMNPAKIAKMDEEVAKWSRKDPMGIKKGMVKPETLEFLERGELVKDYNANMTSLDSEDDEDPKTPASITSQEGHGLDFVDVEAFSVIPDNSLPELNLHSGVPIFEEIESANQHIFRGNYSITSVMPPGNGGNMKPYILQ